MSGCEKSPDFSLERILILTTLPVSFFFSWLEEVWEEQPGRYVVELAAMSTECDVVILVACVFRQWTDPAVAVSSGVTH